MIELPRIPIARQRRVAQALREVADDKAAVKSFEARVRDALAATVAAGDRLDNGREFPALVLDNTADTVLGSFMDVVENIRDALDDRVVKPLTPAQATKKAAAAMLLQRVFADGKSVLSLSMPLQYGAMRVAIDLLRKDKECAAAVAELHVGYLVDHAEAHLAPYGRAVTTADGRDLEAESDAFHEAFTDLAIAVAAHHKKDAAIRARLLGAYETELAAQRTEEREARRSRQKKPQ